ncbi:MAG: hypothetical protein A2941_02530 [Candidatus Yanofskybacteria bacterium RIFCSPLOWO2_01_FULL_49_17]|uniref:PPM-type phosphatase domain-containing protein n=1 Tax=Candidatus Yanofskybacteria bacterium RIFCSPLOWO2_01_FULL_49_17 TaxID=1802700 RepID=A0A1F8GRV4_9BACT|nr:MAG: hypothetical protein A2941_02530 [Candidatus Yanofskybacteria bacterium RIFCSPLOWO2_01_FULL_49_17]
MEKVFIKPTSREIMLKGSGKDGSSDLFSYDYADPAQRGLGHLYVVGNIQAGQAAAADDIDVGYVINLVASLAKREYYSKAETEPKAAFGAALKKINGVIEEFFKQKDTKINIGIFAIAGSQIHISKLGKFKILLARDGENVDILNNIDLFKKETTQEKQFSNIISGAVSEGDRILAFYPSRVMSAREKLLKTSLLELGQDDFAKKLESVKNDKQDFACAAVHVELRKSKEPASEPKPQPKELQEEVVEVISEPAPVAQLAVDDKRGKAEIKPAPAIEIPKIIPAEFSLGRKTKPFAKYIHQLKNMNVTPKNKVLVLGGGAVLVLVIVVTLKSFVFVSASSRALSSAASEANSSIQAAQTKVSQNDLLGAHSLLLSSLASINEAIRTNGTSDKADKAKGDIVKALDQLEQATDAVLVSVAAIPAESGTGRLLAASGADIYAYVDRGESGAIVRVSQDSVSGGVQMSNIAPTSLFGSDDYISAIDPVSKRVSSLSLKKNQVGSIALPDGIVSSYMYRNNLYGIANGGVIKITDAATGHSNVSQWLADGSLAADPRLIAVDGNIYVLSGSGVLSTYYRGEKKNELNVPVAPDADSIMLTTEDGPSLFVVNKALRRIYIVNKSSGALERTLKLNSNSSVSGAAVSKDGVVYVLIGNKVWKVQ